MALARGDTNAENDRRSISALLLTGARAGGSDCSVDRAISRVSHWFSAIWPVRLIGSALGRVLDHTMRARLCSLLGAYLVDDAICSVAASEEKEASIQFERWRAVWWGCLTPEIAFRAK